MGPGGRLAARAVILANSRRRNTATGARAPRAPTTASVLRTDAVLSTLRHVAGTPPAARPHGSPSAAGERIIKDRTTALCATCLEPVEAQVVARGGQVLMRKRCPEHGAQEVLLERDAAVYEALLSPGPAGGPLPLQSLAISVTERCDLACSICYMPRQARADVPRAEIEAWIDRFPGRMVWLSGGEPTQRPDLPRLVAHTRARGKIPVLITNGLRLADRDYAAALRRAGLEWVHFSFNGFDDRATRRINGAPLLARKLRALDNLRRLQFQVALSMLYVQGVNDRQLRPVLLHCLRHPEFVRQLRVRPARQIHRGGHVPRVFLSELLARVAAVLGATPSTLLQLARPPRAGGGFAYLAGSSPCHLDLDLERYLTRALPGRPGGALQLAARARWLQQRLGTVDSLGLGLRRLARRRPGPGLVIRLRAWPDRDSIDLLDLHHCVSGYQPRDGGEPLRFCHALVLNDDQRIL